VYIPVAELSVNSEKIELYNHEQYERPFSEVGGSRFPNHVFNTIQLGANEFEHIDLFGIGDPVEATESLKGELEMDTSDDDVLTEVIFDRAP